MILGGLIASLTLILTLGLCGAGDISLSYKLMEVLSDHTLICLFFGLTAGFLGLIGAADLMASSFSGLFLLAGCYFARTAGYTFIREMFLIYLVSGILMLLLVIAETMREMRY